MLKDKKSKIFKIGLFLFLTLFLIGTGVAAHHIFFRQIEIKIEQIEWVDEFKMEIAEIELRDEPCFLVIEPKDPKTILEGEIQIQKQNINIGHCTNSRILIPLRVRSKVKGNENLFFIPQFRARITGEEELRADFSLHLLTNNCPEDREKIQGKNFILCNLNIHSSNVKSFSITEKRKNTLAEEIRIMANKNDYILVLKIFPCLETVKNFSSFLITVENITPELIIER